jgi:hypothetical protein
VATNSFPSTVSGFCCNCGGHFRRGKKKKQEIELQEISTRKRQYSEEKYCDCQFYLKIVKPNDKDANIEVNLHNFLNCEVSYY